MIVENCLLSVQSKNSAPLCVKRNTSFVEVISKLYFVEVIEETGYLKVDVEVEDIVGAWILETRVSNYNRNSGH